MSTTLANPVQREANASTASLTGECLENSRVLSDRFASYRELAKPRIAVMVVISTAVGYLLGSQGSWNLIPLLHACVGIVLAVVASSALNQAYERDTDSRMLRTQGRPIPSGRLASTEVVIFAIGCSLISTLYLLLFVNTLTAVLTLTTTFLYAGVYTPLKRYTTFCTAVGAIPGAAPPVLGWVAAGGNLDLACFSLFAILFVWQFPHFLAIAWMYKDDYLGAGLKMVPGGGRLRIVGAISLGYALILIPVSLLPQQLGLAGEFYGFVAIVLGGLYTYAAIEFYRNENRANARRLLLVSLVYLPGILAAITFDHLRLLNTI